jgi:hypothetical protein
LLITQQPQMLEKINKQRFEISRILEIF